MIDIKLKNEKKNENKMETLIQMIRIYSQDIRMELGIEKCAILIMKYGKKKEQKEKNYKIRKALELLEKST